jgi:hypothetical protein
MGDGDEAALLAMATQRGHHLQPVQLRTDPTAAACAGEQEEGGRPDQAPGRPQDEQILLIVTDL